MLILLYEIVAVLFLLFAIEWGLGLYMKGRPQPLIFEPNVSFRHETTEFNYTVTTNAWGFRDHEITPKRKDVYRIITLGDSFTYGWGVDLEHTWPKVLEATLREAGRAVEVLNLGAPGASPRGYAEIATRALSVLEPDLVLVAVLQNDDLIQLHRRRAKAKPENIDTALRDVFPNIVQFFQKERFAPMPPHPIREEWKQQAQTLAEGYTGARRQHYETLDDTLKAMFLSGDLNPAMIQASLNRPDYFSFSLDAASPERQVALEAMSQNLHAIDQQAHAYGAEVLVLSMPAGGNVNVAALEGYRRLGLAMPEDLLHTTAMDDATEEACRKAGVDFVKITEAMRARRHADSLFFKYDGHPTAAGYRLIAHLFSNSLLEKGYLPPK